MARFPRAARPVLIFLSVVIRVGLGAVRPRLVRVHATCHERQCASEDDNRESSFHDGIFPAVPPTLKMGVKCLRYKMSSLKMTGTMTTLAPLSRALNPVS
jgi:hypothetical protein